MSTPELKRELGSFSAIMIVIGSVIGSGIFLKPWEIAGYLPSEAWVMACWAGVGLICLAGGFAYAELGCMFPEAGGQYAFLREGWGPLPAFMYGWCLLLIINTGSIAALTVAFSTSLSTLIPISPLGQTIISVSIVLMLAAVNYSGVKWGALLQNISAAAKLGALAAIALAGVLMARLGSGSPAKVVEHPSSPDLVTGIVAACVAIFWAYEGWHQLPFNAAELRNPARGLTWGLIGGITLLAITYLAANAVYLHVVPIEEMRGLAKDVEVPRTVLARIFGAGAANWLAVLICLSVLGAANGNLLAAPRAMYAMAKDGLAFPLFLKIHPSFRTPSAAIWTQALWSIVLIVVLKTFRDLTEYVIFGALIFYGLTVASVYRLRRSSPTRPRPFRCIGYPWTPALFILVVAFVDLYTLTNPEKRFNAVLGLLIIAAGIPAYIWMRRRNSRTGV